MSESGANFAYRTVDETGFDAVRPLWEKLRDFHKQLPWQFAGEMDRAAFESRKKELLAKAGAGKIRIELASTGAVAVDIAYCISTVTPQGTGEVDSIFVEATFRGCGVGSELLRRALAWLESAGATSKVVNVAQGNAEALALYQRFGFYPRTILLQQNRKPPEASVQLPAGQG